MNFQVRNEIGSLFKLVARKAYDGSISKESEWFHNDILDSGLTQMGVGVWIDRVCVGTSNAAVNVEAQTGLQSFLVSTTTRQGGDATGINSTPESPYWWVRRTYRFGEGAAAGNLAEVGLGWSNTNTWNRALIKDQNGNPVIFPVLSDEYLDVISEIRVYPAPSYSGTVNFRDKIGNIISTHTVTGLPIMFNSSFTANQIRLGTGLSVNSFHIFTGGLVSMTSHPTGQINHANISSANSYIGTSTVVSKNVIQLSQANSSHRSLAIGCNLMCNSAVLATDCGYQFQIDPPITKTNQMEITYTFSLSWGRKTL